MGNLSDDIIKYKKGELTPQQMHALEKKALDDPFLAEALEGSESISSNEFIEDIEELNSKINAQRKIIFTPLRIAAGLVLIAVAAFVIYELVPKQEMLALKKENPTSQNQKTGKATNPEKKIEEAHKEIIQQKPSGNSDKNIALKKDEEIKTEGELSTQNDITSKPEVEEAKLKPERIEEKKNEFVAAPIAVLHPAPDLASAERGAGKRRKAQSFSYTVQGAKAKLATSQTITGIVVSTEDGSVLPGVNVVIKGTTEGTITDVSGRFSISTNENNPILDFFLIGFQTKEVDTQGQSSLIVKLENDLTQLSEVVITSQSLKKSDKVLGYTKTIFGIVISSENSSPIPGVNVILKGTTTGTVTDVSGRFSISTDQNNSVLDFFFIGYHNKEVDTKGLDSLVVKLRPR